MIFRRLPASSSFVLAAARLRALQLDPGRAVAGPGQLRGRIQKNSQSSPTAYGVTGLSPYALLTTVTLIGAADRGSARIVVASAATSMTFPRRRLVRRFTRHPRLRPLPHTGRDASILAHRVSTTCCAERGLDPMAAQRPHLELYIRWMQEIRRFKPSTVSRRAAIARSAASRSAAKLSFAAEPVVVDAGDVRHAGAGVRHGAEFSGRAPSGRSGR